MKITRPVDILIVEDSEADQNMFSMLFESSPFPNQVHFASDGKEGSDFIFKRGTFSDKPTPSLIILDLNLPVVTGRELLAEIRKDLKLHPIPVVIVSTSNSAIEIKECYGAGANAFIQKSIDLGDFEKSIYTLAEFWFGCVVLPT